MSVSVKNSTTTPLNNGQTWVDQVEECSVWSSLNVTQISDTECKLTLEFSSDGSNWDYPVMSEIVNPADVPFTLTTKCVSKYFRCKVFNDSGDNQTFLRFQVILQKTESVVQISSMPSINTTPANYNTDSIQVYGKQDGASTKLPLLTDASGVLKTTLAGETVNVDVQNTVTVSLDGENVNIRPLEHGTDSVLNYGWDSSVARPLLTDGTGKQLCVVSASDLDIRALNSTDDAVMCSAYDGSSIRQVKCDNTGRLDTLSTCTQSGSWSMALTNEAISYRNLNVQTTSSQVGNASNVKIMSIYAHNDAGATRYLKLYNDTSADETVTPAMTIPVLAESVVNIVYPIPLK